MIEQIEKLVDLAWQTVAATPDFLTGKPVALPPRIPTEPGINESRFSDNFPALQSLADAVKLANENSLSALASAFAAVEPSLRWSQNPTYTEENAGRALLDGYAYAPCSGPDGPIHCAVPRGGLMLMGPNVTYPPHNYAPREIYLILTPGTQWQLDHSEWFDVNAGDLILHEPWVAHSMRTTDKPMLAFAGWIEAGDRLSIGFNDQ